MTEPTRRFFLGGAVSALVVATITPRLEAQGHILAGNTPVIYGNGRQDDSAGLAALMRGGPVIFGPDKIGVDDYGNVIIHDGKYLINHTVEVDVTGDLKIVQAKFVAGLLLPIAEPLFRVHRDYAKSFTSPIAMRIMFDTALGPDMEERPKSVWIEEYHARTEENNWDPRPGPMHRIDGMRPIEGQQLSMQVVLALPGGEYLAA